MIKIFDSIKTSVKWRSVLCFILLTLVFLTYAPSTAYAYDKDTHYYLKYYLLRKVGFTPDEALIIATADQSTDFGDTAAGLGFVNMNPKWHAFASKEDNDKRQMELWERAKNALKKGNTLKQNLTAFGQLLHFMEDRTPHEGFGSFCGHLSEGHKPDYLSSHDLDTLRSEVVVWLRYMEVFYGILKNTEFPYVSWDSVKDTVSKVRDVNPTPSFSSSPDSSKAKDVINKALKEMGASDSIEPSTNYEYDENGNFTGMIPLQGFTFTSVALTRNNDTILDAIAVIENSSYFQYHPEASVAVQWLYNFIEDQKVIDPSIDQLRYAITNMIGLSHEDIDVLDETAHISLLMLDFVFERESHVLYVRSMKGLSGAGVKMDQAYGAVALAEPEIEKIETTPSDVNFESLTGNLTNAWRYMRDAELDALSLAVTISPTSASMYTGNSITITSNVSGGVPPYTYKWYVNSALNPLESGDAFQFSPVSSGIYYVYLAVTDANNNTAQSETVRIVVTSVPVGGYSFSIGGHATANPLTPYLALIGILTIGFTVIRRKIPRKTR